MRRWLRRWGVVPARGSFLADARPNPGRRSSGASPAAVAVPAAAVGVAVGLDHVLREPPLSVHPVRLIGRWLSTVGRLVPSEPPARAVVAGGVAWTVGAGVAGLAGAAVQRVAMRSRAWLGAAILGTAAWPLFAHRMLLDEVAAVELALAHDLDAGRAAIGRIVSRNTDALTAGEIRQAAIESLGENLSDSVVAPLLWFAVGGLPALSVYRYANTADALWGYRDDRWCHAGKVAARMDDLANLVPARVTGLALALPMVHPRSLRRGAAATPSPNAGWPMAALALRLGVRLEKPGVYVLGSGGREPTHTDTADALRLARRRGLALAGLAAGLAGLVAVGSGRARGTRWSWR